MTRGLSTAECREGKMEAQMKVICVLGLLVVAGFAEMADGAGSACGKTSPDEEAVNLAPCATAAEDEKASVPDSCCAQVKQLEQKPSCLCAVVLSGTVKSSGIKPEVALTIPKRCRLTNRPVGYKCGPYTLP
ncbi:hypothetical protein NMG60_11000292 [Bertholletia excelsa]